MYRFKIKKTYLFRQNSLLIMKSINKHIALFFFLIIFLFDITNIAARIL